MNIVVCLKRVPATTAAIKIAGGKALDPAGIEFIISPYDEFAIEEALRLKEKIGTGEVIGVTVDPEGQDAILRKALAMGVDRGVLVKGGDAFDGAATAEILASALKTIKYDVIFFGKQAVDSDACQVPSYVAHYLGLPRANVVTKLELVEKKIVCRRQIEGGEEVYELPIPCIIACTKGMNEPRYPSLKGIMAAKKKPVQLMDAPKVEPRIEIVKMEPPAERSPGRIVGQGVDAVPELIRLLREEAKVL